MMLKMQLFPNYLGIKFFTWLTVCFLAAGVSLGAVAGDAEDCKNYSLAEDYKRAFPVCSRAAKRGYANAQFNLGVMYRRGKSVPKDNREAVKWYKLAAEQGYANAQFGLGAMYDSGYGVPENDREAVKWYKLAAEQGVAIAQYNLGVMYHVGQGVIQDYQEAYVWLSLAVANGLKYASKRRDKAAESLTVSELRMAQQEAKKRFQEIESLWNSLLTRVNCLWLSFRAGVGNHRSFSITHCFN